MTKHITTTLTFDNIWGWAFAPELLFVLSVGMVVGYNFYDMISWNYLNYLNTVSLYKRPTFILHQYQYQIINESVIPHLRQFPDILLIYITLYFYQFSFIVLSLVKFQYSLHLKLISVLLKSLFQECILDSTKVSTESDFYRIL